MNKTWQASFPKEKFCTWDLKGFNPQISIYIIINTQKEGKKHKVVCFH